MANLMCCVHKVSVALNYGTQSLPPPHLFQDCTTTWGSNANADFRSVPTFARFLHAEVFIANTSAVEVHYKFGTLRLSVRRRRPTTTQNSSSFRGLLAGGGRVAGRNGFAVELQIYLSFDHMHSRHPQPRNSCPRQPVFALCRHQIWPWLETPRFIAQLKRLPSNEIRLYFDNEPIFL